MCVYLEFCIFSLRGPQNCIKLQGPRSLDLLSFPSSRKKFCDAKIKISSSYVSSSESAISYVSLVGLNNFFLSFIQLKTFGFEERRQKGHMIKDV